MWIANAERCREMDRRATEEFGVSVSVLMERAGLAVFEALKEILPDPARITIFCGKGNNGGDGFVVARVGVEYGHQVDCLVAATESELGPDAANQLKIARAQGVSPIFFDDARWQRKAELLGTREIIVDALLGIGAQREVHGPVREAIHAINRSGVPVIAVDVPSGIDCDTGEELGDSVWALRTVTFGRPKPFLFQGSGIERSGYWTVSDIGFPNALLSEPTQASLINADWIASLVPERMRASHKGDNGSVLIVAGSDRYRGAAALAARAAMRTGAGLVTVATTAKTCDALASQLPEAILMELPSQQGVIAPEAAADLLRVQDRFDSAVFGPGLTGEPEVQDFLSQLWSTWQLPCIIDADGLNAIADGVQRPEGDCVFTPHPGEMGRLLHSSTAEIQADRFRTVEQAVSRYRCTVLLKGPYSIVGSPGETMLVNHSGNPGMACGGMGDVLSGAIGTLLAQGLSPRDAAAVGMYWHGLSGDYCADKMGSAGYLASEVANAFPQTRCRMTATCDRKPSPA